MKVLITGGAGYIGSTIATALEAAGHTPVVLDHLGAGRREFVGDRASIRPTSPTAPRCAGSSPTTRTWTAPSTARPGS